MSSDPFSEPAPLSEGEARRLTQLERQLENGDPVLAHALRTGQPGDRGGDIGGIGHLGVAIAVTLIALPLLYIVAVGTVLFIVARFTGWLLGRVRHALGRSGSAPPPPATAAARVEADRPRPSEGV
ncbi:MAG TPA: DUF3040 domain-containing protein [Pseudonocardia sp.]|jgi:hypothetical protein